MVAKMLKESIRVLKNDGVYFAISYGKPETRSFHFEQPFLKWEIREFILYDVDAKEEEKEESDHYIYTCKKLPGADDLCRKEWPKTLKYLEEQALLEKELEAEMAQNNKEN